MNHHYYFLVVFFALLLASCTPAQITPQVTETVTLTATPSITVQSTNPPSLPTIAAPTPYPSQTPIISSTPTVSESIITNGVLVQFFIAYLWGKVQLQFQNDQLTDVIYDPTIVDERLNLSYDPSESLSFSFSHYSDQIAYWTPEYPSTLLIANIRLEQFQPVFTDTNGLYVQEELLVSTQDLRLSWTPDDQHLIVYSPNPERPHLIYHLASQEIDNWFWLCQSVIISPKTSQLALLCPIDLTKQSPPSEKYAIIEWNDEIWFTSETPLTIISQPLPDGTILWSFSEDGQQVAYLDPADSTYSLLLTDASYQVRSLLPGSSILQLDKGLLDLDIESPYYKGVMANRFFQWSRDGELLLALVLGQQPNGCRQLMNSEVNILFETPCWQVVKPSTNQVIWTEKDSITTLYPSQEVRQTMELDKVEFSPDSKFIAVHGYYFSNQLLAVIDLQSFTAYQLQPLQYAQIYWGN